MRWLMINCKKCFHFNSEKKVLSTLADVSCFKVPGMIIIKAHGSVFLMYTLCTPTETQTKKISLCFDVNTQQG